MAEKEIHQVVARKYRPDRFESLAGQTQVATALRNAIEQGRVGHAYLFTGARGVGKTSAARIFAKCLNCLRALSVDPCGQCDVCLSVARGEDVDVIEIDGASNRGIDEIRQLRANVNVRPSRARFKIYIIDEVHMLTPPAFNALLKTLEEPPRHVKFIFCTTDPEKIPVTVLSRCQRFDFPPIRTSVITERLQYIVEQEHRQVDPAALELLARRAGGSMRDSQSLLEQLLSYGTGPITVQDVYALLGTADHSLVLDLAEAISRRDTAEALHLVDQASEAGVEPGQLAGQLVGLFRDCMAHLSGCRPELLLYTNPDDLPRLSEIASSLGVESLLAFLQTIDQAMVRMRHASLPRVLLETAVVRCCHLPNLDLIPRLIEQIHGAPPVEVPMTAPASVSSADRAPKKKELNPLPAKSLDLAAEIPFPIPPTPMESCEDVSVSAGWNPADVASSWTALFAGSTDMISEAASNFENIVLEGDCLAVTLRNVYDAELCNRAEPKRRLEEVLAQSAGRRIRLDFSAVPQGASTASPPAMMSNRQRIRQTGQHAFVRQALELFDGEIKSVKTPASREH